ncbi:MAG: hypothetical protein WDM84_01450 [Bauldia sp.]
MNSNDNPKPADRGQSKPKKPDAETARPLAEEIEEEMLDQDIPSETGIPPARK